MFRKTRVVHDTGMCHSRCVSLPPHSAYWTTSLCINASTMTASTSLHGSPQVPADVARRNVRQNSVMAAVLAESCICYQDMPQKLYDLDPVTFYLSESITVSRSVRCIIPLGRSMVGTPTPLSWKTKHPSGKDALPPRFHLHSLAGHQLK